MCRPTDRLPPDCPPSFRYESPAESDLAAVVDTVYQAHANGYTATVYGPPDAREIEKAIAYRFEAFRRTATLHFGRVARDDEKIIGVCIAGCYPDSADSFSTIHQLSVRPEYRNRGIAKALVRHAISAAHATSPVIGLQVLAGNPAEHLYRRLGFVSGPAFTDMVCLHS